MSGTPCGRPGPPRPLPSLPPLAKPVGSKLGASARSPLTRPGQGHSQGSSGRQGYSRRHSQTPSARSFAALNAMASWYGYTGRRFVLLASLVGLQLVVFLSAVRSGGHGPRGVEGIDPASRQPLLLAIARAAARCIALDTALLLVGICKHVVARLRRDVPWLAYHLPWHHGPVVHVGLACMVLVWTAVHVACHYAIMAARSPAARDAVTSGAGATGHIALLLLLLASAAVVPLYRAHRGHPATDALSLLLLRHRWCTLVCHVGGTLLALVVLSFHGAFCYYRLRPLDAACAARGGMPARCCATSPRFVFYLLPGLVLLAIDQGLRARLAWGTAPAPVLAAIAHPARVVELHFARPAALPPRLRGGWHLHLCCPAISAHEVRDFTVIPLDRDRLAVIFRMVGSWTYQLAWAAGCHEAVPASGPGRHLRHLRAAKRGRHRQSYQEEPPLAVAVAAETAAATTAAIGTRVTPAEPAGTAAASTAETATTQPARGDGATGSFGRVTPPRGSAEAPAGVVNDRVDLEKAGDGRSPASRGVPLPDMRISGPYGTTWDHMVFQGQVSVLISGGMGSTPLVALYYALRQRHDDDQHLIDEAARHVRAKDDARNSPTSGFSVGPAGGPVAAMDAKAATDTAVDIAADTAADPLTHTATATDPRPASRAAVRRGQTLDRVRHMAVQGRRHARPDVWMLCIFRDAQDATWFRSHVSSHAPVPGLRIAVVWKPVAVTPFADGDAAAVALTPLTATASPRSFAPASPTPTPMPSPALDRPVDLRAWCRTRASGLVTVGPVDAPLDLSDVLARLGMRYNPPPQPPAATGPATAAASASLPLPDGDHDAPRLRKYTVQRRGRPHTVRVPLRVAASGPPRLVDGVYAACRSPSGRSCRFVGAL